MHPSSKFHLERAAVEALARDIGFGALVVQTAEGLRAVHVPFLLDEERVRFHISRRNAVYAALSAGCEALLLVDGGHAYISPDWYGLEDRVPTWNYLAAELSGTVSTLDREALIVLVDELSEQHERRLLPKAVWTKEKMSPGRYDGLIKAIEGFELHVREWRATAKLDQDKPPEVRARLAAALRERGEGGVAAMMERE